MERQFDVHWVMASGHPICIHGISHLNLSTLSECVLILNDFK